MKKTIYFFSALIVLFLFNSCQDEGPLGMQDEQPTAEFTINTSDMAGNLVDHSTLETKEFPQSRDLSTARARNQVMVSGHFSTVTSNSLYSYKVLGNNGGLHGQVEVNSPTLGHIHGEVIGGCVNLETGEGGIVFLITQSREEGTFFAVNDIIYSYINDNGEGANAPTDQHQSTLTRVRDWEGSFENPEDILDFWPCDQFFTGIWVDIANGQVQVK